MNSPGYHGHSTHYRVLHAGIAAGLGLLTAAFGGYVALFRGERRPTMEPSAASAPIATAALSTPDAGPASERDAP